MNISEAIIKTFGLKQLSGLLPFDKNKVRTLLFAHAPHLARRCKWGSYQLIANALNVKVTQ